MACHVEVPLTKHQGSYAVLSTDNGTHTAAIFVHGFCGNSYSTWAEFQTIVDDSVPHRDAWAKSDLYFFEYKAARNFAAKSAQDLRDFLSDIFPVPAPDLFDSRQGLEIFPRARTRSIRSEFGPYRRLLLIGHSLGAVVIRFAVANALRDEAQNSTAEEQLPEWLRAASLYLFAPAHRGFRPSGWMALVKEMDLGSQLAAMPVLLRGYTDLQPESELIKA